MHWSIPSQAQDVNEGGTFFFNACLSPGSHTEVSKKVTCKKCKPLVVTPRTIAQAAAIYLEKINAIQEKSDFWASLTCNACPQELDVSAFPAMPTHETVALVVGILEHCAYEHMGGTELILGAHTAPLGVYSVNLAAGKPAMTLHEERWRERTLIPEAS